MSGAAQVSLAFSLGVYKVQMLAYLICDELDLARFLWKRLPAELKSDAQLSQLWEVGTLIWREERAGIIGTLQKLEAECTDEGILMTLLRTLQATPRHTTICRHRFVHQVTTLQLAAIDLCTKSYIYTQICAPSPRPLLAPAPQEGSPRGGACVCSTHECVHPFVAGESNNAGHHSNRRDLLIDPASKLECQARTPTRDGTDPPLL